MHGCINRVWHISITKYYPVIKRQNVDTQNHPDGSPENYTDGKDSQKFIDCIVDVLLHLKNYRIVIFI